MDKLSQHLNFRDSDDRHWNTIEVGDGLQADTPDVAEDFYDQPKHMLYHNAEFFEGMQVFAWKSYLRVFLIHVHIITNNSILFCSSHRIIRWLIP